MKPTDFYWGRVLLDSLLFKLTFNAVTGQYTIMVDCTGLPWHCSALGLCRVRKYFENLPLSHREFVKKLSQGQIDRVKQMRQ